MVAINRPVGSTLLGMNFKESWPSVLGVVYAVVDGLANVYTTEWSAVVVIGAVISNFGDVLIIAGVFTGTFRAFGLHGRIKVFGLGAVLEMIGLYLQNMWMLGS